MQLAYATSDIADANSHHTHFHSPLLFDQHFPSLSLLPFIAYVLMVRLHHASGVSARNDSIANACAHMYGPSTAMASHSTGRCTARGRRGIVSSFRCLGPCLPSCLHGTSLSKLCSSHEHGDTQTLLKIGSHCPTLLTPAPSGRSAPACHAAKVTDGLYGRQWLNGSAHQRAASCTMHCVHAEHIATKVHSSQPGRGC